MWGDDIPDRLCRVAPPPTTTKIRHCLPSFHSSNRCSGANVTELPISTDTSPKAVARSFALRIGPRLAIAFGILLTMMGGLGWFATNALDETARSARLLYQHPFTVTKSLADVRGDISTRLRNLKSGNLRHGSGTVLAFQVI